MGSAGPQNSTPAAIVVVSAMVNQAKLDSSGLAFSPPMRTSPNLVNIAATPTTTMASARMLAAQPRLEMIQLLMLLTRVRNVS